MRRFLSVAAVHVLVAAILTATCYCQWVTNPCGSSATQAHEGDIAYIVVQNITETEEGVQGDAALVEPSDRSKRGATSRRNLLWPGGIVYYTISSTYTSECFVVCISTNDMIYVS